MTDLIYLVLMALFALASWGIVALCDSLMQEKNRP